jgi:hypothetical protein
MKLRVHTFAIWTLAAAFASCTSGPHRVQTVIRFRYPNIDIYGPYAKDWVIADVQQIVELAQARSDIKKPIDQIEVYRADHARVKSGNPQQQGDPLTTFEVRKQNARWMIIPGTVSTGSAIIMEHPY